MSEALEFALRYAGAGFRVLPLHSAPDGRCTCRKPECDSPGKHPRTEHGAHDSTNDEAVIRKWWERWPDANIGMTLDGLVAVDEDPRNGGDVDALPHKLPETCNARTGGGGSHRLYRALNGAKYPGHLARGIDLKNGHGGYIVVEPSVHASGQRYCWLDESEPWTTTPADAPEWLAEKKIIPPAHPGAAIAEGGRNSMLASMAGSMRRRGMAPQAIEAALLEQNAATCHPPLDDVEVRAVAASISRYEPAGADGLIVAGATVYALTEDNLARAFANQHRDTLRFSHDRGRWFVWDGARWREDQTDIAFEWARRLCRELNIEGKKTFAKAATAAAVERFARADRVFAMRGDEWDADPWMLGTPGGTVDLRTGELRAATPADLITRSTLVAPEEGEPGVWRRFLAQVTQADEELERFLQQIAGYALTGDTRHECLFFFYGRGRNGKGTFVGALHEILGDYAASAAMDTFLDTRYERHSTDLAMLRGARMVIASETKKGLAWDEQRVKALTGGDAITARFMRQDNFTYRPAFKLFLFGNHKPGLKSVDEAWRRRFNIIPFTFTPQQTDDTLKARLREEYGQILQWAIDGCLDWQQHGLIVPARVKAETVQYFSTQDLFTTWLEECYNRDLQHAETNAALFASWAAFCEAAGERPGSAKALHEELCGAGFKPIKDTAGIRGRGFLGLREVVPANWTGR